MVEEENKEKIIDIDNNDYIDLNEENIVNQDNMIYNFNILMKIENAKLEQKVCKIILEINKDKAMSATGFFCDIPSKEIKVLLTNNHIIDEKFLIKEKKLTFSIEINGKEDKHEINLEYDRYIYTNKELDFTIIEILREDNINDFFNIDENFFQSENYIDQQLFSMQYPKGNNLQISFGKIINKKFISKNKNNLFIYDIGTESGSSGSPIISVNNLKVIGLHKAGSKYTDKNKKINIGICLDKVIEIIPKKENIILENVIYCKYNISESECGKNVKIYNNKSDAGKKIKRIIINKKEETNEKLKEGKYKFQREGMHFIELHMEETLNDLSYLFCDLSLEEVSLPSLNIINLKEWFICLMDVLL
jgi:hypothetical protein